MNLYESTELLGRGLGSPQGRGLQPGGPDDACAERPRARERRRDRAAEGRGILGTSSAAGFWGPPLPLLARLLLLLLLGS